MNTADVLARPREDLAKQIDRNDEGLSTTNSSTSSLSSLEDAFFQGVSLTPQTWPTVVIAFSDDLWSLENFETMAKMWELSEEERRKMKQLQSKISDIHHWKNDPYEIVRSFKEYKGDLKKIERVFRDMINWRKSNKLDRYLQNYGTPNPLFHYMPFAILQGLDKEGDPITVERMGSCDYASLLKHFGPDGFTNYIVFLRELNNHRQFWKPYEDATGHRVKQFTAIIDFEGFNPGLLLRPGLLPLLKKTARISQDYYGGWCKRILIIRPPGVFKMKWNFIKNLFDPHIQDLIEVAGGGHSNYMNLLDKYIDREVLPPVICPTQGTGKAMPGYYENIKLEGGHIPPALLKQVKKGHHAMTAEKERHIPRKI